MKSSYVQALIEVLQSNVSVDTALTGLKATLERKNHTKLYVPVLLETVRILEAGNNSTFAVVTVASLAQAAELKIQIEGALHALGAGKDVEVKETVDKTLIGGFVATYNHREHDQSYKKSLKTLFESITK